MRLLLHDTFATAPITHPLNAGWTTLEILSELRPDLNAADIGADDVALVPSAEVGLLQETHHIIPDVAVVAEGTGSIALRVPVRPDEIQQTPIRLWNVSGTGELVARATIQPFYGIEPTAWTADDTAEAQAVVVEGVEALRAPEAGFSEDLCRAWFIMTGEPVVTHVTVAPKQRDRTALQPALTSFESLRAAAHERRRDLRRELAERHGLDRDRLAAFFAAQRLSLTSEDRRALLRLLQKGNRGSAYPYVWGLAYLDDETETSPR